MNLLQHVLILVSLASSSVATITPTVTSQNMDILTYRPQIEEETTLIEYSALVPQEIIYGAKLSLTDLIKDQFKRSPIMLEVAIAESMLNPKAYNPEWHYDSKGNKICQGSYGLFQVACVNYKGDPKDLFDPVINIQVAKEVLKSQGIFAWGVCHREVKCGKITTL